MPELAKKALKAGGLSWAEIKQMGWDCYAANTGAVPGMIYYRDTEPFGKRNVTLIAKAAKEIGMSEQFAEKLADEDYNWLAWFAWEYTMSEVLNYLEV